MRHKIAIEVICSILVLLFLYAGLSQSFNYKAFTGDIKAQPVNDLLKPIITVAIPTVEVILSVLLLFNRTRQVALYGAVVVLSIFTIYNAAIFLHLFSYVPCSCSGIIKSFSWGQQLIFNFALSLIAITGLLLYKSKLSFKTTENKPPVAVG